MTSGKHARRFGRTLMVLGNCVAERLSRLLAHMTQHCPALAGQWIVCPAPAVQCVPRDAALKDLAQRALACDCVFTQPLFHYGPCNTADLKGRLGDRCLTFAAPNFEAYFPDVLHIPPPRGETQQFPPPLEWHSRIIVQCRAAGIPAEDVGSIYVHHPLFHKAQVMRALDKTWEIYARREQNLDMGTLALVRQRHAREALFHTWNHPAETLMLHLLRQMLERLGLPPDKGRQALSSLNSFPDSTGWSFGFNAWPIITRAHGLFAFPGREWFRVAGRRIDIATAALAYYNYYAFHPRTYEAALAAAAA